MKEFKKSKEIQRGALGSIEGVQWSEKLEKVFEGAQRSILWAPGVYLGDIRQPQSRLQPYIFTRKLSPRAEVQSRFGEMRDGKPVWERWKYVPETVMPVSSVTLDEAFNVGPGWVLDRLQKNQVEELHYQDRFNNEYQIFLNGIPMLPIGFPLSAISPDGEYNIDWQILQYINPFFAYGRSFVARVAKQADILDEMFIMYPENWTGD